MRMPTYEADFGWGKPVYFRYAVVATQDRAIITQSTDGDDSVILFQSFQMEYMQLFKDSFYEEI